jgi:hypothetical protein
MSTKGRLCRAGLLTSLAFAGAAVSCTSDKKAEPKPDSTVPQATKASAGGGTSAMSYAPGVAGGVLDETFKASATVSAVDPTTRKITLTTDDGTQGSFTAPPEVRNFDQIHAGDKVNATVNQQVAIFVDRDREASATHVSAAARAPKGAKPGALVAEAFEVVATVTSIDTASRRATLKFVDGQTKTVPVRKDVDLSRYKVGDSVVIQVMQQLTVLVDKS